VTFSYVSYPILYLGTSHFNKDYICLGDVVYIEVTASAYRTEDPGFESRQGVPKVLRNFYIAVLFS
jgi:hypothetical protein